MTVDFGGHLYPESVYPDPIRGSPLEELLGPRLSDPDYVAELYHDAGIDEVVLSQPYYMGSADVDGVETANDALVDIVAEYEQFYGLAAVPVAMFLVLQQFDRFDFRIWAGSTALVGVLGLQVLAPELFETIAEEAGVIIVAGGLLLAWRAVSAWRAEANTPDEVNRIEITGDDGEN